VRKGDLGALTLAPLGLGLALVLLMGLHVPAPIARILAQATSSVVETPAVADRAVPARNPVENPHPTFAMDLQPDAGASLPGCARVQPPKENACAN
jgi:hydrogenase-4 component F